MKLKALLAFAVALPVLAQTAAVPTDASVWPKGVPPGDPLARTDYGNHAMWISHRDKNGQVEIHRKKSDIFVIQSGEATLITGGTPIGMKESAPDELLGDHIEGGVSRIVRPGDVVHIPAGVPHQLLLEPGKQLTYLVVKVNS